MDKVIDGKKLALEYEEALKKRINQLSQKPKIVSILIGDDPASLLYSNLKQKKAAEIGINFELKRFPENTGWDEVTKEIESLNKNESIHGIMVQLPLPGQFLGDHQAQELLNKIAPKKDVDGLTGKGQVPQATVKGVMSILNHLKIDLKEKVFGVVGSEGNVGQDIVKMLREKEAKIVEIDKKISASNLNDLKDVEIVISCTGDKYSIWKEHIKDGAILIDVGLGDFDPRCFDKASQYTPERGGVGPMTVVSLMENAVELASRRD